MRRLPQGPSTVKFIPLTPQEMPQDTLQVSAGFGVMGAVDLQNAVTVKREFFTYSGKFTNIGYGEAQEVYIPTDQDGDFWMTLVLAAGYRTDTGAYINNNVWSFFKVQDAKNNYELFTPDIQINMLGYGQGPGGFKQVTNFVQPYCFTRDGAIKMRLSLLAKTAARIPFDFYISFFGWKEYQNVAQ